MGIMLRIFNADDTVFDSNGIYILKNVYSATIVNKINGDFYLECECNISENFYLQSGNIIVADLPDGGIEAFRIRNITVNNKRLAVKAWQLFYDSENYIIQNLEITNMNGAMAMNWVTEHTDITTPFCVSSDILNVYETTYINTTLCSAYMDLAENLGGKLKRHLFNIDLVAELGADRQVVVALGKNITSYKAEEKWENVCTKLLPLGNDDLTLNEVFLYSNTQYDAKYTKIVSFDTDYEETEEEQERTETEQTELEAKREAEDEALKAYREAQKAAREHAKEKTEFLMTTWEKEAYEEWFEQNEKNIEAQENAEDEERQRQRNIEDGIIEDYAYSKNIIKQKDILRKKAMEYLEEHQYPEVSYTISTIPNVPCYLGDTIKVKNPKHDVDILTQVTAIKIDVIAKKVKEITFGNYNTTAKSAVQNVIKDVIQKDINPKQSALKSALEKNADIIQKNMFHSHVYYADNALYFLNAETPEEATKFLIVTLGGIGFGTKLAGNAITGNEEYTTAWDIESEFSVDYITCGVLEGLLFRGGAIELTSSDGLNKILFNPDDGMRITRMNPNTKEEEPILYINMDGYITIVGDGTGLDIENNQTIQGMFTKISMESGKIQTQISKVFNVYFDGSLCFDGSWAFCSPLTLQDYTQTMFTQTESELSLKATKANLISEINVCPENIQIKTSALDLHAYTTFYDLENEGCTIINGDNITTGMIQSVGINIGDGKFVVDKATGYVTSNHGNFGGWIIGDNAIVGAEKVALTTSIYDNKDGTYCVKVLNSTDVIWSKDYDHEPTWADLETATSNATLSYPSYRNSFQCYSSKNLCALSVGYEKNDWSSGLFVVYQTGKVKCQDLTANDIKCNAIIPASEYGTSTGTTDKLVYCIGNSSSKTNWCPSVGWVKAYVSAVKEDILSEVNKES